jgi:hypothetical protein
VLALLLLPLLLLLLLLQWPLQSLPQLHAARCAGAAPGSVDEVKRVVQHT